MIHKHFITGVILLASVCTTNAQSYEWGGRFGGNGEDVVRKLYVDKTGNSFVTGYFTDTADFSVNGTPVELISNGFFDVFVQKTDNQGQNVWTRSFGSSSFEYGTAIVNDNDGNVYVSGVFDSPIDFDPGPGSMLLTSNGEQDIFLVKYNTGGVFQWAKNIGGETYDESTALGVDSLGNVYLSGYFNGTADFDPGPGTFTYTGLGSNDNFIAKYSPDGELIWAKNYGSSDFEAATSMRVQPNGDSYITGFFNGSVDFDPGAGSYPLTAGGNNTGYLLRLDADGDFIAALSIESSESVIGYDVYVDQQDMIYLTGIFTGTLDLNPGLGTDITSPASVTSGYMIKLDPAGNYLWGKVIAEQEAVIIYTIDANPDGQILISGYYENTTDFNPDDQNDFLLTPAVTNAMGAFIALYDNNGEFLNAFDFAGCGIADYHGAYSDENNNIYIAGAFESTGDMNPEPTEELLVDVIDFRDNYLIKMSAYDVTGLQESSGATLSVYPNPVAETLHVESETALHGAYSVYTIIGQLVLSGEFSENEQSISTAELPSGYYQLRVGSQYIPFLKK